MAPAPRDPRHAFIQAVHRLATGLREGGEVKEFLAAADERHQEFLAWVRKFSDRQEFYLLDSQDGERLDWYWRIATYVCSRVTGPPVLPTLKQWCDGEQELGICSRGYEFLFHYDYDSAPFFNLLAALRKRLKEGKPEAVSDCCLRIAELDALGYDFRHTVADDDFTGGVAQQDAGTAVARLGIPAITQALIDTRGSHYYDFDPRNRHIQVRPPIIEALRAQDWVLRVPSDLSEFENWRQNFELIAGQYKEHNGDLVTRKFFWDWTDEDYREEDDDGEPLEPADQSFDMTVPEAYKGLNKEVVIQTQGYLARRHPDVYSIPLQLGWGLNYERIRHA